MEEESGKARFPEHCRLMRNKAEKRSGGWKEALVSGGEHLKRALEEYGELGFECLLEELEEGDFEGCSECFRLGRERMFRVYVRRRE